MTAHETDLAITSRRSVRAFLPTPVPRPVIEAILDVAARAPSGTNMQPWRGHVLIGAQKDALCDAVCAVFDEADPANKREVKYYPDEFFEPYLSRRRKVGWDPYGLLGIGRGDAAKMRAQHRRNFRFFDAPVGIAPFAEIVTEVVKPDAIVVGGVELWWWVIKGWDPSADTKQSFTRFSDCLAGRTTHASAGYSSERWHREIVLPMLEKVRQRSLVGEHDKM
jgi:hypothetical protein